MRGQDYHKVIGSRLRETAEILQNAFPDILCRDYLDSGVLPEVAAARLSGVAMTGSNGLAICKQYGSFVFLGFIAVYGAKSAQKSDAGYCENCGLCVRACPSGALKPDGKGRPVALPERAHAKEGEPDRRGDRAYTPRQAHLGLRPLPACLSAQYCSAINRYSGVSCRSTVAY